MEISYEFDRDRLLAHIKQWERTQARDRYPNSNRELARQAGISHTSLQNYRKGRDAKGNRATRMNYETALGLSTALPMPLESLLPSLLVASTSTQGKAA